MFAPTKPSLSSSSPRILLIHGHDAPRLDIRQALAARYAFDECPIGDFTRIGTSTAMAVVVDVPLITQANSLLAAHALAKLPNPSTGRAFIVDDFSRANIVRAHAFGGEMVIPRPLDPDNLYNSLDLLLSKARSRRWALEFKASSHGLEAGTDAMESIFQLASTGTQLTQMELYSRGDAVIHSICESGLGQWIEAVKSHHSQTFRHCLLVTGVAVGFGRHLGMRHDDLRRLSLGGLLHDIGKAAIPVEILEKPGTLDPQELSIMREHAALGRQILVNNGGFADEMINVVAQHHEMLDGSGYPTGMMAPSISDLVRIMTISDIFSALIELRSYKPQMSNDEAYDLLLSMGPKLDQALVCAFRPVASSTRLAA